MFRHSNVLKKAGLFNLRFFGTFSAFLMQFVIANQLGATASGLFFISWAIVSVLSTFSRLGFDYAVTKFIAQSVSISEVDKAQEVFGFSLLVVSLSSLVAALCSYLVSSALATELFGKGELAPVLAVMSLSIAPYSVCIMTSHALQGIGKIGYSILCQVVLVPLVTVIFCVILVPEFGLLGACFSYVLASLVGCIFGLACCRKAFGGVKFILSTHNFISRFSVSIPILISMLAQQLLQQSPLILLGMYVTSAEAGVFGIAQRVAAIASLAVIAGNYLVAPKAAAYFKDKDFESLQSVAKSGSKVSTLVGVPICLSLIIFREQVLTLFGDEFVSGAALLVVLVLAQISNLVSGSASVILMMTNLQKQFMKFNLLGLFVCFSMCLYLVPSYGVFGAAFALFTSLFSVNMLRVMSVKSELGISVLPVKF